MPKGEYNDTLANLEAEVCLIGAAFCDQRCIDDASAVVSTIDFWLADHQAIWSAILDVHRAGEVVNRLSVADRLEAKGQARVADVADLAQFLDRVPHAVNAVYHAQIIREKAIVRAIVDACQQTISECHQGLQDCQELLAAAEKRVFEIGLRRATVATRPLGEILARTVDRIERRSQGEVQGLRTGWRELDYHLGGIDDGQLVIVAGRPSMGKTSFAMNLAEQIGAQQIPVIVISIEQSGEELGERMLSGASGINSWRFKGRVRIEPHEWPKLHEAQDRLASLPVEVCDASTQSISSVVSIIRRHAKKVGPCVSIVDHVGMIEPDGNHKREARHTQLDTFTRHLKAAAKEIGRPTIVLSQLSRNVTNREDKTPHLADLRESGALEQNADVVMLIHRPEYYDPNDAPGTARVIVAKNRNGAVGTVNLAFDKQLTKFKDLPQWGAVDVPQEPTD